MTDHELIDSIDVSGEDLTEWEVGFIEEMIRRLVDASASLTPSMRKSAEKIFDTRCN